MSAGDPGRHPDFDAVREVADAVLYEGYLLYPYRASATKNQLRWQFGVVVPAVHAAAHDDERSLVRTQVVAEPRPGAALSVGLRHLRLRSRGVERARADGTFEPVSELTDDADSWLTWDDASEVEHVWTVQVDQLGPEARRFEVSLNADEVIRPAGTVGRIVSRRWPLRARVEVTATPLSGPFGGVAIAVAVQNTSPWDGRPDPVIDPARQQGRVVARDGAIRRSLLGAHVLLGLSDGVFLSSVDPPEWASTAVAECINDGLWPVLAGPSGAATTVLAAPIILPDHPAVAPESPGHTFDGTEIDEILTLRARTLTAAEKWEAALTDPRARGLIDAADHLPAVHLDRLHGALAALGPAEGPRTPPPGRREDEPTVLVDGTPVGPGSVVRLRPGARRADAQDMFLTDRLATVRLVLTTLEDDTTFAVTLQEDPGADLKADMGRFLYFSPDEVTPVSRK